MERLYFLYSFHIIYELRQKIIRKFAMVNRMFGNVPNRREKEAYSLLYVKENSGNRHGRIQKRIKIRSKKMRKRLTILFSFILLLSYALPIQSHAQDTDESKKKSGLTPEDVLDHDFEIFYQDLEGIPSESGSHTGGVSVIGENAFVVGVNPDTSPLIAAARYGDGRVLAAGMSEYIDLVGESETKSILTRNIFAWLTEEQEISYLDALAGDGEIAFITNMDLTIKDDIPIEITKVSNWLEKDLSAYQIAYVDNFNNPLSDDEIDVLLDFIRNGGALLFAQKGWVMDEHPKDWMREKYTHPRLYHYGIQGLLNEVGLSLMTNNAASTNEIFPPLTADRANDYHILQLIDQSKEVEEGTLSIDDIQIGGSDADAAHKQSIISTLISGTIGGLTASSPLLDEIREDAHSLDISLPFDKKEYLYSNALFTYLVNQASLAPDQEKSQFADVFPGKIAEDTPIVNEQEIVIDFDYADFDYIRMNIPPGNWISTGLYAPAGEAITIEVPEGVEDLDIQIGAHTDNLMGKDIWHRAPIVTYRESLETGTNEFMSPYGGLVYFIPTEAKENVEETITVNGLVHAPYFKKGETTNETWNETVKHYDAPWSELHGDRIILTLPSDVVRKVDDPEALMDKWDEMVDQYDLLIGVSPDLPLPHRSVDRAQRFVFDIQVGAGLMHAGYPMVGPIDRFAEEAIDLESDQLGSWGFWHEIGHQYQQKPWIWGEVGEVTTNIHSIHIEEYFGKESNLLTKNNDGEDYYDQAFAYLEKDNAEKDYSDIELFERLVAFMQLQHAYGWEFYTDLQTAYRELAEEELPTNDQEKKDLLAYMTSTTSGEDLISFFDAWGISITTQMKEKIAKLELPEPAVPIWTLRVYKAENMTVALIQEILQTYQDTINKTAYRLLTTHLTAVKHYEKQGQDAKVKKHMEGFKQIIDYHYDQNNLPLSAHHMLTNYADSLLNK